MARVMKRHNLAPSENTPYCIQGLPVAVPEIFIDKPEVARRVHKTERTIDHWMASGLIPFYKVGRSVLFKWSEIEAHLAKTCRVTRGN